MAYTFLRRGPSCWTCHRRRVNLFTVHGSTGHLVGILCARCSAEWLLLPDTTVIALDRARRPHRRARHRSPALG